MVENEIFGQLSGMEVTEVRKGDYYITPENGTLVVDIGVQGYLACLHYREDVSGTSLSLVRVRSLPDADFRLLEGKRFLPPTCFYYINSLGEIVPFPSPGIIKGEYFVSGQDSQTGNIIVSK